MDVLGAPAEHPLTFKVFSKFFLMVVLFYFLHALVSSLVK